MQRPSKYAPLIPILLSAFIVLYLIHAHSNGHLLDNPIDDVVEKYCYDSGYSRILSVISDNDRVYYCTKLDNGSTVVHNIKKEVYINIAK